MTVLGQYEIIITNGKNRGFIAKYEVIIMLKKRLAASALALSLVLMTPGFSMAKNKLNLNKKKIEKKEKNKDGIGSLVNRAALFTALIGAGFVGAYYLEKHVPKDPNARSFFRKVIKPVTRTFAKWVIPVTSFIGLFGKRIARRCGEIIGVGVDIVTKKIGETYAKHLKSEIVDTVKQSAKAAGIGAWRGATGDVFTKLKNFFVKHGSGINKKKNSGLQLFDKLKKAVRENSKDAKKLFNACLDKVKEIVEQNKTSKNIIDEAKKVSDMFEQQENKEENVEFFKSIRFDNDYFSKIQSLRETLCEIGNTEKK